MTECALRPDSAGPRSGSELPFSNRIRVHFVGIGGVGSPVAEVPPAPAADREHPRKTADRDRAGARSDSDFRSSNPPRGHCGRIAEIDRSAVAEVRPGLPGDRERHRLAPAARRLSRPTAGNGAAARLARRPVAPGERRAAPEAAR